MKTISITIPEQLDAAAAAEAQRRGISKSELIRLGLAAVLPALDTDQVANPWVDLAGFGTAGVKIDSTDIDTIVYGV